MKHGYISTNVVKTDFCYLGDGQERDESHVKCRREQSNRKIMALAVMTGRGIIPLKFIPPKTKINGQYYCDRVLKPLVHEWLPIIYPEGLEQVFVHHDAAPSHVCKLAV